LAGKATTTAFCRDADGAIDMDFHELGITINSALHCNTQNFETTTRRVRLHKNILLEHDNANPRTSPPATEATEKLDWISPLTTTAMQSRLGATRLHLFQKRTKTFVDICVTPVKRWNALSGA